jgi:hypothetical protein
MTYYNIINHCIKEDISRYFNNSETINELVELINNFIMSKTNNEILRSLYYRIGNNLKNKDEFINGISQKLMERIIYTNIDETIEIQHLHTIINEFLNENKLIYKYKTIFEDFIYSKKFKKDNMNLIVTSLDVWNINHKGGYSNNIYNYGIFSTILCNNIFNYNTQQTSELISKKLNIYSHIGYVDINIGNTNLIILPAHMYVLEQFETINHIINYDILFSNVKKNMDNYNNNIITKIINSLVIGNIITIINNNVQLNLNLMHIDFINVIDIFHNMTAYTEIIKQEMQIELALERIDIINANINHFIKLDENLTLNQLFDIIKSNIKIFSVSKELFDKSIDKMISNEYIEIKDDIVHKLLY